MLGSPWCQSKLGEEQGVVGEVEGGCWCCLDAWEDLLLFGFGTDLSSL